MPSAVLVLLFLFVQYGCCGVPRWFNNITGLQARGAGLQCLMRSTPTLNLSYPADPEAHFLEIHKALRPYTQPPQHRPHGDASGFHGPWIENEWITRSRQLLRDACITSTCLMPRRKRLRHLFGPFIPLLLTWVDSWVAGFRYPPGFVDTLLRVLRPNVAYVTVSQNDEGLVGKCELPMARIPNVLVLSSGGYGHVPVPLYHRAETPPPSLLVLKRRGHFVSYVGSADHAPFGLRQSMIKMMHERLGDFGVPVAYYRGPQWRKVRALAHKCRAECPGESSNFMFSVSWPRQRVRYWIAGRGCVSVSPRAVLWSRWAFYNEIPRATV